MKNKNKYFKIISSILIVGAFILIAFGSGNEEKKEKYVDINNASATLQAIQGKHDYEIIKSYNTKYRIEISGNKLKLWSTITDKFDMTESPDICEFSLGDVVKGIDGYDVRYLENKFDEDLSLSYRAIEPFWVAEAPEGGISIRCSGGGGIFPWGDGWK
jgi:hypothetical protein